MVLRRATIEKIHKTLGKRAEFDETLEKLTINGFIDDISIGQSNFNRMFFIFNLLNGNWNRFICKCDITSIVKCHTECKQ